MTSIHKGSGVLTLINVFTVAPDKQGQLVDASSPRSYAVRVRLAPQTPCSN